MKNQNVNNSIKWDKVYATYWWIIYLDPNHPANTTDELIGYSKSEKYDEASDKELLLMRRIVMFYNKGYFTRIKRIEIYKRHGHVINKEVDSLFILLGRDKYNLLREGTAEPMYARLRAFLPKFYDAQLYGKDVQSLLPSSRAGFSKDDWLNVSKAPVMTARQLEARCARMVNNGHSIDAVYNFKMKYLEKYPNIDISTRRD